MASCSTINEEPDSAGDESGGSHNSYKLSRLYLRCAPYLTRELLLHRIRNTDGCNSIQDFLAISEVKTRIVALKTNKRVLSQIQYELIYPSNDTVVDLRTWDVSLLMIILNNCFDLQILETNVMDTMKQYRGFLFGKTSGFVISDADFDKKWNEMTTFFHEAAENLLTKENKEALDAVVDDVHRESVSSEHEKEFLLECHKWLQEISEDGKPVKTQNRFKETMKILRAHGKALDRMHLTAATTEMGVLIGKFKSTNILTLKGPKGSGKTHLAQSILCEMMREDQTDQVILRTPSEIQQHLGGRRKLLVLVDGALGQFVLDLSELREWNNHVSILLSQIEEGKLMIVITIRTNILEACKEEEVFDLIKKGNTIDVTTFLDKRNALVVHAAINEVRLTEEKIRTLCSIDFKGVGFQLLCSKFVKGTFEEIVPLFKNPVHIMKDEVHGMQTDQPLYFITLLLTLFSESKLKIGLLEEETSRVFSKIKQFWGSLYLDAASIERAANDLVGLYLTTAGDGYSFLNDTVLETVFLVAIETVQSLLMDCCPLVYLRKFTGHIESHRMSFSYLVSRLEKESDLDDVALLKVWDNEMFVKAAVEKLGVPAFYKQDETQQCLIVYFSGYGHLKAIKHLDSNNNVLKSMSQRDIEDQLLRSLMNACANSQYEIVEYFVLTRHVPVTNEMMFESLQGKDDPKVLSFLINNGADIRATRSGGENVFHVACEKGKVNILEYVYIISEEMAEATDKRGWTALHFAAKGGSIPCYEFVNNYRKYPADVSTKKGSKVIHLAAEGSSDFLAYLVSKGISMKLKTNSEQTVLHLAALLRNVDTIWYICEVYRDLLPLKDENGWNALHFAAKGGSEECIRYLIGKGLDPRSPTADGRTVLHIAAESGMQEAVAYLCKTYKALYKIVDSIGRSPLYVACLLGHSEVMKQLIKDGMDTTVRTFNGETVMHACIRNGLIRNLEYVCVSFHSLLASIDNEGNNILHFAAVVGSPGCLDYLLTRGLNPYDRALKGKTILQSAASKNKLDNVKYICENFPDMINSVDEKKRNALYYAAMYGDVDLLKHLLNVGCETRIFTKLGITLIYNLLKLKKVENATYICDTVDEMLQVTDADGNNPLHYAAIADSLPFLTYLLETKNTDPFIRNYLGKTMLHLGSYYGHLMIVKHICRTYRTIMKMEDSKEWNALHDAASGGSMDCLIYLIRKGTSAGVRTADRRTILHIAAHYGQLSVVTWICKQYKSMLTELGDSYWSVLHDAASGSSVSCMKHLIKQGIDPMVRTADGKTILHVAACFGKVDTVDYLCAKHKELINERDFTGNTALHHASMGNKLDNFIALILENIDKHAVNMDGSTALHAAAKVGATEIVAYICRNHLEFLRVRDRYSWTALHCAAAAGSKECVEILIKNGMNPEAVTKEGATILTLSMEHNELHEWLRSKMIVQETKCEKCIVQ